MSNVAAGGIVDPRHSCLGLDERLREITSGSCIYCGSNADTRDHLPSKVLLDEPYPPQLCVVRACGRCNASFSMDEQYLACLLECVLCGTTSIDGIGRPKVKQILEESPALRQRIEKAKRKEKTGVLLWEPEEDRVGNVLVKLARGHATYELAVQLEKPVEVRFAPLDVLSEEGKWSIEHYADRQLAGWPEIGSRAFYRACGKPQDRFERWREWVSVQAGRYRYSVTETDGILVRMVLSEYLVAEVIWEI